MRVRIHKLTISSPNKPDASLNPEGLSHLVYGPTDTGKSYIEECIAFCLGSENHPKNVGYSEGYTRAALQLRSPNGKEYTFFRDLVEGREVVYEGFHSTPPQSSQTPAGEEIEPFLVEWGQATGKKILTKSGTLGSVTANDLRRLSLFDEIRTLDKVTLEGKDKLFKMRNCSTVALTLSGIDDSNATLTVKTDQRNIAKGHAEALHEEIKSLQTEIPKAWTREDCTDGLKKLDFEIKCLEDFLADNASELDKLKDSHDALNRELDFTQGEIKSLTEARDRFHLLDKKYLNDANRLTLLITASEIAETFEPKPCPLCKTDLTHNTNHATPENE